MRNSKKKCSKYRAGDRDCILCNEEKLSIASYNDKDWLNQTIERQQEQKKLPPLQIIVFKKVLIFF